MKRICGGCGWVRVAGGMILAWTLASCSDVVLKPNLPEYFIRLAVPAFQNRSVQPNLENELTQQLVQEFLVDGRLEISDPQKADGVLQGTVVQYQLLPLLMDVHNTPQQYKLLMVLRLTLKDNHAGKNIFDLDAFEDSTTYYVANNLGIVPEDELTARRRLIQQLSKRIVTRVIEGF